MPRLSEIAQRNRLGLIPKSRMTKDQKSFIEKTGQKPDRVEYYFGRRCEYWRVDNFGRLI